MGRRTTLIAAAAAFVMAGCNNPESEFIGTYTGVVEFSQDSDEEIRAEAVRLGRDPDELMRDALPSSVKLELHKHETFIMTVEHEGETTRTAGDWSVSRDGTKLTLENTRQSGFDSSTESGFSENRFFDQAFSVSPDRNSFSLSQDELGLIVTVTFSRT